MIGTGCTTVAFGTNPPVLCTALTNTFGSPPNVLGRLKVQWAASAGNTSANGCSFNCQGGTCRVRGGDGLPVELMEFSVDGSTDPEPTDDPEATDEPEAEDATDS